MDIENIVKQMTQNSKKFYQNSDNEKDIIKVTEHRDFLRGLYNQIPEKYRTKREKEVAKILKRAVKFFSKQIRKHEKKLKGGIIKRFIKWAKEI